MKQNYFQLVIILFISSVLFCFCSPANKLQKGQYLLNKNNLRTNNYKLSHDELLSYIKPKPNRKILGIFKLNYLLYRIANNGTGKETKLRNWIKNTLGEPPVLLDTNLIKISINQINLYLNNKGFFNSSIKYKIKYFHKKANVSYIIKTPKPYVFRKITYSAIDTNILFFMLSDSSNSLIKKKKTYDIDLIEHERDRITLGLKSKGYYKFSKEYIYFSIDSSLNSHQMDIEINVKNIAENSKIKVDSVVFVNHKRFKINNIYIYPDYNAITKDTAKFDTISFKVIQRRYKKDPLTYYFLYKKRLKYKPKTLTQAIFIKNNDYYNLSEVQETYNTLSGLQNFKFINVNFYDYESKTDSNLLNCKIRLTRLPRQSFTLETEGTNSGGDPGIAANIGYQNNNFFRGAEILSFKIKMALEAQKIIESDKTQTIVKPFLPFNTIETGVETNLEIPKFLMPIRQEWFAQYNKPKTNINIGLNYQRRTDFSRIISNISFGYKWKETSQKTHIINPIEISSVNIKMDSAFQALISSFKDKILQNSYTNHLTAGLKYSYIYNDQEFNKKKDFTYFRTNIKTAGNLLWTLDKYILDPSNKDDFYTVLNNRYAQFVRLDADYRYYNIINDLNTIVYRAAIGVGVAYENFTSLPFEESFFSGGANGVRAWEIRSLGPGSYLDQTNTKFDKTGEIKLEANLEYRFPIYKLFKGATFIDAGNIWLKNKTENIPGGDFQSDRFYKEIALGFGLGARLDFSFFVIRVDAAIPLKDPSKPENHRWVLPNSKISDVMWNFGIGYPF